MKMATSAPASNYATKHGLRHKFQVDDAMVIAVLLTAALCILILLASSITVTGRAHAGLNQGRVISMLNSATVVAGEGRTKCSIQCGEIDQQCLLARQGSGILRCSSITSGSYSCLCSSVERSLAPLPKSVEPAIAGSSPPTVTAQQLFAGCRPARRWQVGILVEILNAQPVGEAKPEVEVQWESDGAKPGEVTTGTFEGAAASLPFTHTYDADGNEKTITVRIRDAAGQEARTSLQGMPAGMRC